MGNDGWHTHSEADIAAFNKRPLAERLALESAYEGEVGATNRAEQPRWEFHNAEEALSTEVGRLFINDAGGLEFTGNIEESARVFIKEIGRVWVDIRLATYAAENARLQHKLNTTWTICRACGEWVRLSELENGK